MGKERKVQGFRVLGFMVQGFREQWQWRVCAMGVGAWTCETATTDSCIATNAAHSRSLFWGPQW